VSAGRPPRGQVAFRERRGSGINLGKATFLFTYQSLPRNRIFSQSPFLGKSKKGEKEFECEKELFWKNGGPIFRQVAIGGSDGCFYTCRSTLAGRIILCHTFDWASASGHTFQNLLNTILYFINQSAECSSGKPERGRL
jgi:hypothetical protein